MIPTEISLVHPPVQAAAKMSRWVPLALLLWFCSTANAQWPTPQISSLMPPSGQAGTTFDVTVNGANLDDLASLEFSHPGISAEQKKSAASEFVPERPINNTFTITIDQDVPLGVYEARVRGRWGTSNPRRFVVAALPQIPEQGNNRDWKNATATSLNQVVYGQVDANAVDYFRIPLEAGQQVVIECRADEIDSRGMFALVLVDGEGNEIERIRPFRGTDPYTVFRAQEAGDLVIGIHDFLYRGGGEYYYRLLVHDGPFIESIWPPVVPENAESSFTLTGWNLPQGKPLAAQDSETAVRESAEFQLVRDDVLLEPSITFDDPTAYRFERADLRLISHVGRSNPFPLLKLDVPAQLEPNEQAGEAEVSVEPFSLPLEMMGRFDFAQDIDRYRFTAKQGDRLWIEVQSEQLGCTTDPLMMIHRVENNEDGSLKLTEIAVVDDPANRAGMIGTDFDLSTDDPSHSFEVPADGTYQVTLRDLFSGRLEPRDFYRLRVSTARPDFEVVAHPTAVRPGNANQVIPSSVVIRRGAAMRMDVSVHRQDGYEGLIRVEPVELPPGVHCQPLLLPGSLSKGTLMFFADKDAAPASMRLELKANGEINGESVARNVTYGTTSWGTNNRGQLPPRFRLVDDLTLDVLDFEKLPISIADAVPEDDARKRDSPAGRVYETAMGGPIPFKLAIEREEGFNAAFNLIQVGLPNEFGLRQIGIPADSSEFEFTVQSNNRNLRPGWYRFHLQGDVRFKYQRNPPAIEIAQQEQQRLQELIQSLESQENEAKAQYETARNAHTAQVDELKNAEVALEQLSSQMNEAQTVLQAKMLQLDELKAEAAAKPDDMQLAENITAKEQELNGARQDQSAREQQKNEITERIATLRQESESAAEVVAELEQRVAQLPMKLQQVRQLKQTADQTLQNVQNVNREVDLTELVYTRDAFLIHLVPSAVSMEVAAASVAAGAMVELPVSIVRDYGFNGNVNVDAQFPSNPPGVSMRRLTLNADQNDGMLQIRTSDNTPPGEYPVSIKLTGNWNNYPFETVKEITLTIQPKSELP